LHHGQPHARHRANDGMEALAAVIAETEARCPVMNLLLDAKVDLRVQWIRDSDSGPQPVPRP
jgi:hypothetical protein